MTGRAWPLVAAVGLAVAPACASKSLTQLVVVADTDLVIPQQVDEIDLVVTGPSGQTSTATASLAGSGAVTPPLTLALSPGGDALSPVLVRVVGKLGGQVVLERDARTDFVGSDDRELPLDLTTRCLPVACPSGSTCDGTGACVPVEVDASSLPEWPGAPPARMAQGAGGAGVTAVSIGERHGCALTATHRVFCWGNDDAGELGDPSLSRRLAPHAVPAVTSATAIAAGVGYTCALEGDGTVACWGADDTGQLGDGNAGAGRFSAAPQTVRGLQGVTKVDAGEGHACALDGSGAVFCWGRNPHGELGDGTTVARSTPVRVQLATAAVDLAVGEDHTCALLTGGTVQCWGSDEYGQLGDGGSSDSPLPRTVVGLEDVQGLDTGSYHSCAVLTKRAIVCWGRNDHGQLGDGRASGDQSSVPVAVAGLSDSRDVVAGELHTCARADSGVVSCWGDDQFGQLGDGGSAVDAVPVAVVFGDGFLADEIATGNWSVCARRAGGAMRCWGRNDDGQLADGTTTTRRSPVDAVGLP